MQTIYDRNSTIINDYIFTHFLYTSQTKSTQKWLRAPW